MMNVATGDARNVYENFEVEKDIYYFKVGALGLISFHGKNYNIKKSLSAEQLNAYIKSGLFIKVSGSCYVNATKIHSFSDGKISFDRLGSETKQLPVSKWRQNQIKTLLSTRKSIAI